jgi:hypothetical protein
MSIGDISIAGNGRRTSRAPNVRESSRTLIAVAQMIGDGLILTTSSYLSLSFVVHTEQTEYIAYLPYVSFTVVTTVIMAVRVARCGMYDVSDALNHSGILGSTFKHLLEVMLLLTACLFVFKVSDNVSRLWLATWSITSAIALYGFRLLTASAAQRLRRSGQSLAVCGTRLNADRGVCAGQCEERNDAAKPPSCPGWRRAGCGQREYPGISPLSALAWPGWSRDRSPRRRQRLESSSPISQG